MLCPTGKYLLSLICPELEEIEIMGLLIIDENKCNRDAYCVRECPAVIIHLPEGGFPEIIPGGICLECGHCVAACPHGALNHKRVPIEKSPVIREELRISEEQALQFVRSRRSIRHFLQKPVEDARIKSLIDGARYAPTGGNGQMVEWLVLTDKKKIREIASITVDWLRELVKDPRVIAVSPYLPRIVTAWDSGYDSVLRDAPAVVVASAPKEAVNGMVDLTIALTYLDLLAPSMGLGTCWAGLLQGALLSSPAIKRTVGIPEGHPHHYPIMLGYPDAKYYRLPERRTPKITFA
jgi:nitroreductase/NAD-dependent dihydropyrimidine dehydrogenase PreA subunit